MGGMMIRSAIAILATCFVLHADESGIRVMEFCKVDLRFEKHLLNRNDLNDERNQLRQAKFRNLANLISFVEDHKVNLILKKGENDEINETYAKFARNMKADIAGAQLDLIINVNPRSDFASAYYSIVRELVFARLILKNIHNGKITDSFSFEEFSKIYKTIHKQVISLILEDFDEFDGAWIKAEGIEADVKQWKKNELSQVSKKGEELPDILKRRAKLFFDSYKSIFDGA
jgi:hypothetical protein